MLVFSLSLARYGTIQKTMGKQRNLSMYIIKNALRCIGRSKGRNILIGIIALVIAVSACIGLSIRQAADSAKESMLDGMSVTATNVERFVDISNKYTDLRELTPEVLRTFIERIIIHKRTAKHSKTATQ